MAARFYTKNSEPTVFSQGAVIQRTASPHGIGYVVLGPMGVEIGYVSPNAGVLYYEVDPGPEATCSLIVRDFGENKIMVIKALRQHIGFDLKTAKNLVCDSLPPVEIGRGMSISVLGLLKADLDQNRAQTEINWLSSKP